MNNLILIPTEGPAEKALADSLVDFFKSDFEKHIGNLWKTRQGLYHIYNTRPDLKESILPQLKTLNGIIGELLKYREYHPHIN